MSAKSMKLHVVSAEASLYEGDVAKIVATGSEGELGIMPGHSQLLTALKPGQVEAIDTVGKKVVFYISSAMLEVQPMIVTVLADTAARAEDLDEAKAQKALEQAEAALTDKKSKMDYVKAQMSLAQAAAQLEAIRKLRKLK